MNIKGQRIKVEVEGRFPLPVHSIRETTGYNGDYCHQWRYLPSIELEIEEDTVDSILNQLDKLPKLKGSDATKYEVHLRFKSEDGRTEQSINLRHDIDINLHTYISEDGKIRIQYESGYGASDHNAQTLFAAAKKQGIKLQLKSVNGFTIEEKETGEA